jgi:hypothetical protein
MPSAILIGQAYQGSMARMDNPERVPVLSRGRWRHSRAWLLGSTLALTILAGCATQVAVDGEFSREAERLGGFSNLLVVAVTPDLNLRCAFEQSLAFQLRSDTVSATTSCAVTDHDELLTRELVEQAAAQVGADAVIVSTLIGRSSTVAEGATGADSRGGAYYKVTDIGYAGVYWGGSVYPAYGIPVAYAELEVAESVFTVQGTARLSTSVFETGDATLVYMMDTQGRKLESRSDALALIAPAIAKQLRKDGVVR